LDELSNCPNCACIVAHRRLYALPEQCCAVVIQRNDLDFGSSKVDTILT
jgi:hypothetical protein